MLILEAAFAEACLLETYVLSVLNHDSAIAAAASRMTGAAGGRTCIEMGSRRAPEESAPAAARAAVIGGFAASSNLEAGRRFGLKTVGTAAHAFTLLHDSERAAFAAQLAALGPGTTLLVDTYDVEAAVRVRDRLDRLGNVRTKIVVTSDLDEYSVAALRSARQTPTAPAPPW